MSKIDGTLTDFIDVLEMKKIYTYFRRENIRYCLKLIAAVLLLAVFFYYIRLPRFFEVVRTVSPAPFLVSILLGLIAIYIASIELWIFARKQGIFIPVPQLFILNLGTRFYSFVSPFSSAGSIVRWYRMSKNQKSTEGLMAVAANRVLDVIIAMSAGLFWGITTVNHFAINTSLILIYMISLISALWMTLRISIPAANWIEEKERNNFGAFRSIYHVIGHLLRSLSVYQTFSSRELGILVFTALTGELATLLAYALLAFSVHIPISIADLGWIRSLLFLAALTPFTLIGGLGLREVSAVLIMSGLGVAAEQATVFSFLLYSRNLLLSLIGGAVELILFIVDRKVVFRP